MRHNIPERDWKHFKKLRDTAIQRLCGRALEDALAIASDSSQTNHERFLQVYQQLRECDQEIESSFEVLSRSRMMFQLARMRLLALVDDSDLRVFTEQTIDDLDRFGDL